MRVELISKLSDVDKNDWNNLNTYNHPFTSYDFLNSLEVSKSVHSSTGWNPQHIIIKNTDQKIIGVSPNYLKMHSYGEYIFDHSWANAFENAGGQYYPKLICAIPFTPATGPRIMINPENKDHKKIFELIIEKLKTGEQITIEDLKLDNQLLEKINKFAPIKYILKNQNNDDQKIIELLEDISRDLMNYDLEFRIQELESKFSVDMSETTFNELKELKKKQNLN